VLAKELDQAKTVVQEKTIKEELPTERGLWNHKPELKVVPPNLKYSFL